MTVLERVKEKLREFGEDDSQANIRDLLSDPERHTNGQKFNDSHRWIRMLNFANRKGQLPPNQCIGYQFCLFFGDITVAQGFSIIDRAARHRKLGRILAPWWAWARECLDGELRPKHKVSLSTAAARSPVAFAKAALNIGVDNMLDQEVVILKRAVRNHPTLKQELGF